MMKKNVLVMLAAAAMVSCSEKNDETTPVVEADQVSIAAQSVEKLVDAGVTRAPYLGSISAANPLEARVVATLDSDGSVHADGNMIFTGGTNISLYQAASLTVGDGKFPTGGDINLAGLYPATGWALNGGNTAASITINGNNDVMVTTAQVSTTATAVAAGTIPTLEFNHLLTKLEIEATAESSKAATFYGQVKSISLKEALGASPSNNASVTLADGNATFSGALATPFYGLSAGVYSDALMPTFGLTTQSLTPVAYSMVAPIVSGSTNDLTLEIVTDNLTTTVDVELPAFTSTQGRAFGIQLTFKEPSTVDDYIQVSAKVIDWIFSGNVPVDVD